MKAPVPVLVVALASIPLDPAAAQTLRDKVKEHVEEELDKDEKEKEGGKKDGKKDEKKDEKKKEDKKRKKDDKPRKDDEGADKEGTTHTFTAEDLLAEPEKKKGPEIPIRVLGNKFKVDIKLDGGYRGWHPQQYESADVDVGGYYTWSATARAKLWFINLHRGYYESNALNAPRTEEASVAADFGKHIPKAAWAMAMIGVPIFKRWEPIIRYEARAFNTTAKPKRAVCIVSRDTPSNFDLATCDAVADKLQMISSFETLIIGVQYNPPGKSGALIGGYKGKLPPIYGGLGLMSYNKPYQVTIAGNTLEELLFDGRFRGAGLAVGTRFGGKVGRPYGHVDLQLGLGQVSLTEDLDLNELAPEDWMIGYIQGDVGIGYRHAMIKGPPALILNVLGTGGGASFHFVSTSTEEDRQGDSPSVNWDFLWSIRVALELAF